MRDFGAKIVVTCILKELELRITIEKGVFNIGSREFGEPRTAMVQGEIVFLCPFFPPPKACEVGEKQRRLKQHTQNLCNYAAQILRSSRILIQ